MYITIASKESSPVRPIPAYKAGLYGLTENRQLSNFNSKQHSSPFTERGFLLVLINNAAMPSVGKDK
jgi:hypothetical protein